MPPSIRRARRSTTPSSSTSACPISMAMNWCGVSAPWRSEEHTSELQALMRISYAVFCLKKKTNTTFRSQQHNYEHHLITWPYTAVYGQQITKSHSKHTA